MAHAKPKAFSNQEFAPAARLSQADAAEEQRFQVELARIQENAALAQWEQDFAKWLAKSPGRSLDQQAWVASKMAGTTVSPVEVRWLKYRPEFRTLVQSLKPVNEEAVLQEAKEHQALNTLKAAKIAEKALETLDVQLSVGEDPLAAVRASAPLLGPYLDRAFPKKEDQGAKAPVSVHITLSPGQAYAMHQQEIVVEAEEILPAIPSST